MQNKQRSAVTDQTSEIVLSRQQWVKAFCKAKKVSVAIRGAVSSGLVMAKSRAPTVDNFAMKKKNTGHLCTDRTQDT